MCNAIIPLFSFLYCCSKFPKTDYTYSRVSPHRRELAPGVIAMPNMSRRSLSTVHQHSWPENEISSGTGISVSKHDVTKSRWFDESSSGRVIKTFVCHLHLLFFQYLVTYQNFPNKYFYFLLHNWENKYYLLVCTYSS